jgi:thiaminase/transcriptional activator TenA
VATDSFSQYLRAQCEGIWEGLHAHPFIQELALGTLPLEKFRFFLEQDLMYLPEYARCVAMGAAKSRTDEELRYFAGELAATIDLETPQIRQLLTQVIEVGAEDRGGGLAMAPATVAYTSYMAALGLRGGTLEITAAILPCAWSYQEIAERLAGERKDHPIYTGWIDFYLMAERGKLVRSMRDDFDATVAAERPSARRLQDLAEIFAMSSRLEARLWQMAYTFEQWPDLRRERSVARS